jgi:ribosomal RNA-processing protein 9
LRSDRDADAHTRTGSWDGTIRLWRLDRTLRSFALAGELSAPGVVNSLQLLRPPATALAGAAWAAPPLLTNGVNGAADGPRRGKAKDKDAPVLLVAALAREPRMGRWVVLKDGVRNEAMVVALRPRTS